MIDIWEFVEFDKNHFPRHFSSYFKIKKFFFFNAPLNLCVFTFWIFFLQVDRRIHTFMRDKGRDRHTPRLTRIRRPLRQAFQLVANLNRFAARLQSFTPIALDQHFRRLRTDVFELVVWLVFKTIFISPSIFYTSVCFNNLQVD